MNLVLDLSLPRIDGTLVLEIRKSLGWSRDYLSKKLCVSHSTIYAWEAGLRKISLENQEKLLALLRSINKLNQEQEETTEQ